jgi:hypothetical protein
MEKRRGAYRDLVGKPERGRTLGRPSVDGRIILKWIFENLDGAWTELVWPRIGTCVGLLCIG